MNIQDSFPFRIDRVGSPCSPRDSQESSPTPQFKSISSSALSLLHSPTLTSIYDHWKQCQTLFFWAPKSLQMVTATMKLKDAYSLEGKLWPTIDSIFKSRDITLPTKVHLVKAMVFPVVMFGCENLTLKKAECWRIDAFELWCWRRLLRIPWTARRSN